jgi:hypothetical protein
MHTAVLTKNAVYYAGDAFSRVPDLRASISFGRGSGTISKNTLILPSRQCQERETQLSRADGMTDLGST